MSENAEEPKAPGAEAPAQAPPAATITVPAEVMGRPLMNFIADMVAAAGALLLVVCFFFALRWQWLFFGGVTVVLVIGTISFAKAKNWGLVYLVLGGYELLLLIISAISRGAVGPLWVLGLIGTILMAGGGLLQWLVFKDPKLGKPWPMQ